MGSVAAAYFFQRLVELTPAKTDQEYIETFIHNNTSVPDRTRGMLYGETSPLAELQRSVSVLNNLKVDYILFACITSHYFIPDLQKMSKAHLIDGTEETARHIYSKLPEVRKAGILASTGAIKVAVFHRWLSNYGIETVVLRERDQEAYFMEPVYAPWGIKAGNYTGKSRERFLKAVEILVELGAEAIIGGCSEVPLVLNQNDVAVPFVDSIDILLQAAVTLCLKAEPK